MAAEADIAALIIEGLIKVGPVIFEMIAGAIAGDDPIDVLARKRVGDILPTELESVRVLREKRAAAIAVEVAELTREGERGTHAEARRRDADG